LSISLQHKVDHKNYSLRKCGNKDIHQKRYPKWVEALPVLQYSVAKNVDISPEMW
jgi:hypothetical protein